MVDMIDFDEIRKDYDRWFAGDPYAILYINKPQYEVMVSEIDKYKRLYDIEHRRRVAAEAVIKADDDLCGIKPQPEWDTWQSIIKEAGE